MTLPPKLKLEIALGLKKLITGVEFIKIDPPAPFTLQNDPPHIIQVAYAYYLVKMIGEEKVIKMPCYGVDAIEAAPKMDPYLILKLNGIRWSLDRQGADIFYVKNDKVCGLNGED